jgi:hypothetical protein
MKCLLYRKHNGMRDIVNVLIGTELPTLVTVKAARDSQASFLRQTQEECQYECSDMRPF